MEYSKVNITTAKILNFLFLWVAFASLLVGETVAAYQSAVGEGSLVCGRVSYLDGGSILSVSSSQIPDRDNRNEIDSPQIELRVLPYAECNGFVIEAEVRNYSLKMSTPFCRQVASEAETKIPLEHYVAGKIVPNTRYVQEVYREFQALHAAHSIADDMDKEKEVRRVEALLSSYQFFPRDYTSSVISTARHKYLSEESLTSQIDIVRPESMQEMDPGEHHRILRDGRRESIDGEQFLLCAKMHRRIDSECSKIIIESYVVAVAKEAENFVMDASYLSNLKNLKSYLSVYKCLKKDK